MGQVGLSESITYYVRVSAKNLVGYGATQWPEPAFQQPTLQVPGMISTAHAAPQTGVAGNLSVTWNYPRVPAHGLFCGGGGPQNLTLPDLCPTGMGSGQQADGGTPILSYKVEWDTSKWFNSTDPLPEHGFYRVTNLAGGEPFRYTIPNLTPTKKYYVRILRITQEVIAQHVLNQGCCVTVRYSRLCQVVDFLINKVLVSILSSLTFNIAFTISTCTMHNHD